jgi:hypothetical protein
LIFGEAEVQDWAKQSQKGSEMAALDSQQAGTVALLTTGPESDRLPKMKRVEFLTGDSQNGGKNLNNNKMKTVTLKTVFKF